MFSMKRAAALLLTLLLAACGGGGGDSAPDAPPVAGPAPGPVLKYPIPANLWSAPAGAIPATGNTIYLQSDQGDYVGAGRTYSYANANADITVASSGLVLNVGVRGNENWTGQFRLPLAAGNLQAGYFSNLSRAVFNDPAPGALDWSGEARGCSTLNGWIAIDKIEFEGGAVTALDLRFEQHCEGQAAALRGQIRWTHANANSGRATGPAPIPAGLWQPAPGTTPASGNYLYLQGSNGDYISRGQTYAYTAADTVFTVKSESAGLHVDIVGNQRWSGDFQGMQGLSQLSVGYYGGLQRYPFHNAVLGGLSWTGESRGCNRLSGWFVIDKISYSGTTLTEVTLRFEQYCDGSTVPLRGKLHWAAADGTAAAGPEPIPAGLWSPGASFLPPAGNYVYLVSDHGDYIGQGRTELLTPANSSFVIETNLTAALRIATGGWQGHFVAMNTLSQLKPGFYGGLQRLPFHNPAKGGMDWSGNARGCNTLNGWFAVDKVAYELGQLTAIDLRFEQHCDGAGAALRGVIHWSK